MRKHYAHKYHYLLNTTLLLVVYMCSLVCTAQHFSKLYHDGRPSMLFGSVDYNNGTYYTTGVTNRLFSPYVRKAFFGKINDTGVYDTTIVIGDTTSYWYENFLNNLKVTKDGNYIFIGSTYDSLSKAVLIKVDTFGNILLRKDYPITFSNFVKGQDVIELPGEGYLIAINVSFNGGNSDVYIIRTDTVGEILNANSYGLNSKEWPWVMQPMLNGNFLVGAFSMKTNSNTPFWSKTWLIEVDSMGNKLNEWIDNDIEHLFPHGMKQTADSGWIVVRQHVAYDLDNVQAFNCCILKLDKNFNREWEIDTGLANFQVGMYDIEILPSGDYICCGAVVVADSLQGYGAIMKISKTGEILWQKNYLPVQNISIQAYLYDIDILPNGDLLACGEKSSSNPSPQQQAWLLRTDSNGCELENCLVGIDDIQPQVSINVYPNPFNYMLNISVEHVALYEAVITVSNPLGQVMYTEEANSLNNKYTLDLHYLQAGMYYISVAANGEQVVRTVVKE